ncbi:MAG TPA: alpha/beta hydrolase [Castellaniella sp.]|uniref:alpha/beta fold hydrolase n=1 Tax=Castellaniella sp. TaxID=1955812 RepID=UPI002EF11945
MPSHPDLPHSQISLPAGDLHYTQAGQGPAILLIHGSLCDYRYWRWQIPALAEESRVLAPSLRGCWPQVGHHPQPGYAIESHARDLQQLVHGLNLTAGVHVVGHSRGAQVAMAFAHLAPGLCRSLTLADPGFRFEDEPEVVPFYTDAVKQLSKGTTEAALETFVDAVNGQGTWHQMVSWFKEMVRDNAMTLLSQIHEANLPVTLAQVRQLRCPLLLMGGTQSPAKYGTRQDRLQQLVPHAQRVRIALSAHGMNLSNPRAFNRALLNFVQTSTEMSALHS